jgi:hypothetical protein
MCRPSRFKAQGLHRAAPPGTLVQERTTHVGSKKQVAVPFWLLLLLFLLVSLWLMMALLSDSMLLRVPPSTERQQVISTAVKPLQPSGWVLICARACLERAGHRERQPRKQRPSSCFIR